MKIAYCIPSLYIPGGMERVLSIKANYFADILGYEVFIILTDEKEKKPYYELSSKINIINLDINFNQLWGQSLYKKAVLYFEKQNIYKKRLTECLNQIKPDFTVSMLRREINFINSIHDGSIKIGEMHVSKANFRDLKEESSASPIKKIIAFFWMKQLTKELRKLAKFIVLSHEDEEKWTELNNICVIHDPLSFFPDKVSDCINKQVIAVGRYVYQKGFDTLIKSWSLVNKKHPEWTLRIYGEGSMKTELEELIRSLNLSNCCILEPTVPNISEKYIASSIFVLSSRFEGFGMVITEAMACGVPAVSFACPCGPKDIISDGVDGLLVECENSVELAEKICYMIENEEKRKEMGRQARINVEKFKMENIANQWKELFESLCKNK
ncbi:MAG: glycosyltransferase family 4 protein [Candidatus Cloacimonetes bacterium]|nr:glycosyltransferase family 4 protein [Candidatus Cloacimonadota bacterium]